MCWPSQQPACLFFLFGYFHFGCWLVETIMCGSDEQARGQDSLPGAFLLFALAVTSPYAPDPARIGGQT